MSCRRKGERGKWDKACLSLFQKKAEIRWNSLIFAYSSAQNTWLVRHGCVKNALSNIPFWRVDSTALLLFLKKAPFPAKPAYIHRIHKRNVKSFPLDDPLPNRPEMQGLWIFLMGTTKNLLRSNEPILPLKRTKYMTCSTWMCQKRTLKHSVLTGWQHGIALILKKSPFFR